jgi:murein L,D-transpeptidase YcbB/YkuD
MYERAKTWYMRLCRNPILILICWTCWILEPLPARATFDNVHYGDLLAQTSGNILRIGSRGEDVEALQMQLQKLGYYSGAIDGKYGITTKNAVHQFQRSQDLPADGNVGNETRTRLQAKANVSRVSLKSANLQLAKNPPTSSGKSFVWWSLVGIGCLGGVGALLHGWKWFSQKRKPQNGEISPTQSTYSYSHSQNLLPPTPTLNPQEGKVVEELHDGRELESPQTPLLITANTSQLAKINIVEELVTDLRSQDASQRLKTIWDLGQQGDSRAIQPLVDLMVDADSQQRSLILAALAEISTRSLKPLNRALAISLQDESPQVRQNAIRDLTRVYDMMSQVSQMLYHATEDTDAEVQATAKYALGQMNRMRSLPAERREAPNE